MLCLGAKVVINAETSDEQEARSYDIRFYRWKKQRLNLYKLIQQKHPTNLLIAKLSTVVLNLLLEKHFFYFQ